MEHKLKMFVDLNNQDCVVEVYIDVTWNGEDRPATAEILDIIEPDSKREISFALLRPSDRIRITDRAWDVAQELNESARIAHVREQEERSDEMQREG
jgi:hypothetical protein